jgi:hypothetical protein
MNFDQLVDLILENKEWLFSGIGVTVLIALLALLKKFFTPQIEKKDASVNPLTEAPEETLPLVYITKTEKQEAYRITLGRRHKNLRENYLKLNPREMASFYGLETVTELEIFENGDDEFPTRMLEQTVNFFFINKKYLEEGGSQVFRRFEIYSEEPQVLIDDGFKPYFLCSLNQRHWLYAFPVLHKIENRYSRTVVADVVSSFKSSGGRELNILRIIHAMLKKGLQWHNAGVLLTNFEIWESLENGTFYSKDMFKEFGFGSADFECQDIFQEWFTEQEQDYQSGKLDSFPWL